MQLKVLEEKQKLADRQHHEKELQLKEKHRVENELIERKLSMLKEFEEGGVDIEDVEEEKSVEKVTSWLNNTDQRNSNANPQNNFVAEGNLPTTGTSVDPATIEIRPQLSSTKNHIDCLPTNNNQNIKANTQIHKPNVSPNVAFKSTECHSRSFDSSIIAARHVIGKKLPLFDGNPLQWPTFLSQFENSTKICQLTDSENLIRLEALKGDAHKAVEKLLYMPENVSSIIEILRKIFGRPEYIINSLLEDIRSEQKPKYEAFDSIIAYSLQVNNLCATMKTASMSDHLWNPMLIQELVDKLPSQLRFDWAIYKSQIQTPVSLETFNNWFESRAVSLTAVLSKPPQLSKFSKSSKGYVNLHESSEEKFCVICLEQCKGIPLCPKFIKASYSEKWGFVKMHNACRICLKIHKGRCSSGKRCEIAECPFKHHTLLHKPIQQDVQQQADPEHEEEVNFHNEASSSTLFKVVPVCLYGKDNRAISTYAFLDEGSSITLIDKSVADELHLTGTRQPLCLRWTRNQTVTDYESRKVSVAIGTVCGNKRFDVRTIQNLKLPHQSMNVLELQFKYPHLKGIPVKSFTNVQPRILIGLDNVQLCSTNKIKAGRTDEPIAAKTVLGWSIYGNTLSSESMNYNLHICECEELSKTVKHFISFDNLIVKDACQLTKKD